ncbi:MAG TPA: DUF554 domain-containing protein [Oscillospiraceae bacterium]|nr:DUF554 domain-containing protein [Oscillospiraceae bacterium]HNW04812.1 DUF554 domain-containing protein [Oscillospiraceae bacterium]
MTGTIVNALAVALGGLAGLLFNKGISESLKDSIFKVEGVAVLIIGLNGLIANMFTAARDGSLSDSGGMLLLLSLVLGTLCGELLRIDDRMNAFGVWVEHRMKAEGFAKGFVSASIIFCVGSMAIIGALSDGLSGDSSVLFVKSVLDGVTAMILASTMGAGVLGAAVPVLLYQGAISLFASSLSGLFDRFPELLSQISMVGYTIVLCIGINFLFGPKIKTANLIPSIFVPLLYNLLMMMKNLWR